MKPQAALLRLLVLGTLGALVLLPLVAALLGGFKTLGELRAAPFGWPQQWQWQHHAEILASARFWQQMGMSLLLATLTVLLTLLCAATAAFAFVHVRFFGSAFLLNYLLLGLLFPAAAAILPLFIQVRDLGLLDSPWGVVLPQVAFGLAASVLLVRNAFRALPQELMDAAHIDGCGYFGCLRHVVLPLARPIFATVAVISFVHSWNSYLLPLVVLNRESLYPWPLGVMAYQGEYSTDWPRVLAFVTLSSAPALLIFLAAQRHLVAGLTAGAVKG
jgi:raffinose/stachyose/melibiose transport system permease protein